VHLGSSDPKFVINGRRHICELFEKHLEYWTTQLRWAPSVEVTDHIVSVHLYHRPKMLGSCDAEFRERLHNVTTPLSESKVFEMCLGPKATRESRMEVVANLALQVLPS
jgi:hypothetical protein